MSENHLTIIKIKQLRILGVNAISLITKYVTYVCFNHKLTKAS